MDEKKCSNFKKVAIILAIASFLLGVVSFIMPPRGFIDSSVIAFVAEIFGFCSLLFAWESVERGIDAKIRHGQTEIELNNPDKPNAKNN